MSRVVRAEPVMGTVVTIDVRTGEPDRAEAATEAALGWLHWVDATFSPFRTDSQISRLDAGTLALSACHPDVRAVLRLCASLRARTGGYFDVRAAGRLDPCGVVKGWAVERVSRMLAAAGCPNHLVDGGGDVRLRGRPAPGVDWRVGIAHPWRPDACCAALRLGDGAVATSGTYRRGMHVTDPHRGTPAGELAAVTLVGPELTLADAYATAALAMGSACTDWLAGLTDHEALVVAADGRCWETPGFTRQRAALVA